MADVSHELGSLRLIVDSPLSSKVAMFNNQAQQHKQSQLLNPFSNSDGRCSPKPQFSKDEYGKPLAGSLTEMRGQKANIHVMKEMLELCQIIDSEGYSVKDEPTMRVIPFGELFNIYNYISDKVVGILLRARKHKIVEFEGEMLFQRRDDDVPVFLLKPIQEIRRQLEDKMADIKRASSPAPQATSVLLDKSAHMQKLKSHEASLEVPKTRKSKSRSPSPSPSPAASTAGSRVPTPTLTPEILVQDEKAKEVVQEVEKASAAKQEIEDASFTKQGVVQTAPEIMVVKPPKSPEPEQQPLERANNIETNDATDINNANESSVAETDLLAGEIKTDINNNNNASEATPTVVIEATAVHVRSISTDPDAVTAEVASAETSAGNAAI